MLYFIINSELAYNSRGGQALPRDLSEPIENGAALAMYQPRHRRGAGAKLAPRRSTECVLFFSTGVITYLCLVYF